MNSRGLRRQFAFEQTHIAWRHRIDTQWFITASQTIYIFLTEPLSAGPSIGRNQACIHIVGMPFAAGIGGDDFKPNLKFNKIEDAAIAVSEQRDIIDQFVSLSRF